MGDKGAGGAGEEEGLMGESSSSGEVLVKHPVVRKGI
jgi:hypothetical protein